MLFNKTYQSLMKSIMEDREFDEPKEVYGHTQGGVYEYENDELILNDIYYQVTAKIGYNKDPEDVDVNDVEITNLFKYDPSIDDNVEINLNDIEPQLRQNIESRIEEDFLDQISDGNIDFKRL